MRPIGLLVALVGSVGLALTSPALPAEVTLPVTKITAFSSGVAYFEHNGKVADEATVLLKFKTEQINDILKSLVVMDLGGGDVNGVNYGSRDPLTRALKSFGVDISGEPTLGQLLKQIRGSEVILAAPEKVQGKILGVETRSKQILPSNTLISQEVLNLLTDGGIKAIPLDTIASITLADKKLNEELNKALALLVESRDTNRKPVQINFSGKGERAARIGYIAEAPIWKTSYRLVFGDKKDQATLQGWAIVENTSDFDWEKVELTLVSGRPISFVQDLYTPLYVPRPVVRPELYASLRPQEYEEGLALESAKKLAEAKADFEQLRRRSALAAPAAAAKPQAPGAYLADRARAEKEAAEALQQGVRSVAAAKAVGELFSYPIKTPVSLPRRKSAMLPIVNQPVQARKVSIYNASVLPKHPLNGVWLTNDTGLSLLAGPVTVFDEGTYGGDARIGNLSAKDKRLLSYAIDLNVTVDSSDSSSQRIISARIDRGTLHYTRKYTYTRKYAAKNKADKQRTLVIEHPLVANRKLLKPEEPAEKTEALYRFEFEVPAGKTQTFEVDEEHVAAESMGILPTHEGTLQWYATSGEIPKEVRDALAKALAMKRKLSDLQSQLNKLTSQLQTIERGQDRLRKNIATVDKNSTLGIRYLKKLNEEEDQIDALVKQIQDLRKQIDDQQKELSGYLEDLKVG